MLVIDVDRRGSEWWAENCVGYRKRGSDVGRDEIVAGEGATWRHVGNFGANILFLDTHVKATIEINIPENKKETGGDEFWGK